MMIFWANQAVGYALTMPSLSQWLEHSHPAYAGQEIVQIFNVAQKWTPAKAQLVFGVEPTQAHKQILLHQQLVAQPSNK